MTDTSTGATAVDADLLNAPVAVAVPRLDVRQILPWLLFAGLLALVGLTFFILNTGLVPISADPAAWWSSASWLGWSAPLALAIYGYVIAVARPSTPARI